MADDDNESEGSAEATVVRRQRSRLSQADMPVYPLLELYPIAEALLRLGAPGLKVPPTALAQEMSESATSSSFRSSTAASVAYGLTDAGAQADVIGLTDLGRRLILPGNVQEAHAAAVEALQGPHLMREVLQRYDGRPWPPDTMLRRRLVDTGYPASMLNRAVATINQNVRDFHLLDRFGGGRSILRLEFVSARPPGADPLPRVRVAPGAAFWRSSGERPDDLAAAERPDEQVRGPEGGLSARKRVFLSVPLESPLVAQLSEVLAFGGYLPVLPPDEPAQALSAQSIQLMRQCSAVVVDLRLDRHRPPEPDDESLLLIGAAVALCGPRTVFLCPHPVAVPSAVSQLPRVHYDGHSLDYDSTMALVRVFNQIRGNS